MHRLLLASVVGAVCVGTPLMAQQPEDREGRALDAPPRPDLFTDLDEDLAVVKHKLLGLAEALPDEAYAWRPGEGVRSVRETFLHVAADNYFIPIALGAMPPASTGITDDVRTAQAFERQELSKREVRDVLEHSFDYLRGLLADSDGSTDEQVILFGRASTVQKTWILTTTHLHEHLGQMIAYARTNGVAPPWSM